jgi:hypothetical protein
MRGRTNAAPLGFLIAIFHTFSPTVACADDGTGLKISVAVDTIGSADVSKDAGSSNKFGPREAEFSLYAPIDHIFDGELSAAAHDESGVSIFELHEAYLGSDRLIEGSRFRLGQFFLGVGRLNRIHRHDWPFISAPLVHEKFFGPEGVIDSGLEYSVLLPLPFYLDVTAGICNGFTYGHAHNAGEKPIKPTRYGRIATFASFRDIDIQPAVSGLARQAADGESMELLGLEYTMKVPSGGFDKLLLQAEIWERNVRPKDGELERAVGYYIYPQYDFHSRIQAGIRYDYLSTISLRDANGKHMDNAESAYVPTVALKPSEFSTLRIAFNILEKTISRAKSSNRSVELQGTFVLGAHPAHNF